MESNKLILVLDDETSSYKGILRVTGRLGANVVHFENPPQLLEWHGNNLAKFERQRPNSCVVFDAKFSDIFRSKPLGLFLQHCPKICISRPAYTTNVMAALNFGLFDYIEKPFRLDNMRSTLEQALSHHELTRQIFSAFNSLTKRELQTCELVVRGMTSKEISENLAIAVKTVKVHRANLMRKIHANSVTDLLRAYDIFRAISETSHLRYKKLSH